MNIIVALVGLAVVGWIVEKIGKALKELPIEEKREYRFNDYITYKFEKRWENSSRVLVKVLLTHYDGLKEGYEENFTPVQLFTIRYEHLAEGEEINIDVIYECYLRLFQELKKNKQYEEIEIELTDSMVAPLVYGSSNFSLRLGNSDGEDLIEEFTINSYKKQKWFAIHRISDGAILDVFDNHGSLVDEENYAEKKMSATNVTINL